MLFPGPTMQGTERWGSLYGTVHHKEDLGYTGTLTLQTGIGFRPGPRLTEVKGNFPFALQQNHTIFCKRCHRWGDHDPLTPAQSHVAAWDSFRTLLQGQEELTGTTGTRTEAGAGRHSRRRHSAQTTRPPGEKRALLWAAHYIESLRPSIPRPITRRTSLRW